MPLARPDARQWSLLPDGSTAQSLAFGKSSGDPEGPGPSRRSTLRPADIQDQDIGNPAVSTSAASPDTYSTQQENSRPGAAAGPAPASDQARDHADARQRHEEGTMSPGHAVVGVSPSAASPSGQADSQSVPRQESVEMQPGGSTSRHIMQAQSESGAVAPDSTPNPIQQQPSGFAATAQPHSSRGSEQTGTAPLVDTDIQLTAAQEGTGRLPEQKMARPAAAGEYGSSDLLKGAYSRHISLSCQSVCMHMSNALP